jgi:hypothetical protein
MGGRLPHRASAPPHRPLPRQEWAARPPTALHLLAVAVAVPVPQSPASSSSRRVAAALARPARTRTSKGKENTKWEN